MQNQQRRRQQQFQIDYTQPISQEMYQTMNFFLRTIKSGKTSSRKSSMVSEELDWTFQQSNSRVALSQILNEQPRISQEQTILKKNDFPSISKKTTISKNDNSQQQFEQIQQRMPKLGKLQGYDVDENMDQVEDQQLVMCTQGCGRKFNKNSLHKHELVCKKVFQQKRQKFDTAQQRKLEEMSEISSQNPSKSNKINNSQKDSKKVPKWKLQSEAFRLGLKASSGQELSAQDQMKYKQIQDEQFGLIKCQYCQRSFNEKAAEKHIPFCQSKQKMAVSAQKNKSVQKQKRY